jgi:hypothetical protein
VKVILESEISIKEVTIFVLATIPREDKVVTSFMEISLSRITFTPARCRGNQSLMRTTTALQIPRTNAQATLAKEVASDAGRAPLMIWTAGE